MEIQGDAATPVRAAGLPPLDRELVFGMLLDELPAGAYVCDADGLITYYNRYAVELWGRAPRLNDPADRFCGSFALFAADGTPLAHADCWMARALRDHRAYEGCEITVERPDGERVDVLAYANPILGENDRLLGAVNVLVDVTERRRVERQKERAERRLRRIDRRKNEFLATLAHELRNPLAPIRNAAEYVRMSADAQPDLREASELIDRQVGHLSRLVDDLLDVARIARGKLQLRRERVALEEVVRTAVETARPLIDAAGHELAIRLPAEPVTLDGDMVRLSQVLLNLLSNAARYSDAGSHIELVAERSGDEVMIRVRDDGQGIPAERLPDLFEMFVQGERSSDQGGLGIGLSLVRSLVEMHGGRVSARSDGPGKGSEFEVRVPVAVDDGTARAAAGRARETVPSRRVLIVDDNEDAAVSLEMLLSRAGHEVRCTFDSRGALEAATGFGPEVILLDIGLPDLDGYETCRRLRADPGARDALLVAVTGWGQEEDRRRALDAGFDEHMTKPVDPAALRELLARGR